MAKTTQKRNWLPCDRYLANLEPQYLALAKAREFVAQLQLKYANTTIATLMRTCINPCVNQAIQQDIITRNPYKDVSLPKIQSKPIMCFEPKEVKHIIGAFYSNEFVSKYSRYQDSWYAPYVEFLALTGCRPEEAIPLTWDDIKERDERTFIKFSKAYSQKILLDHTKTHTLRLFPYNDQLKTLINSIKPTNQNELNLLFPSQTYSYIIQNDFASKRCWKRVIKGLVQQGKIKQYLKPYALRHSFITRLVRDGVDIKTVASLSGNSVKTIIDHYLASRRDYDLPEL